MQKKPIDLGPLVTLATRAKELWADPHVPPGPWHVWASQPDVVIQGADDKLVGNVSPWTGGGCPSAMAMAAAREDVPALADGVLDMAKEIERLRAALLVATDHMMHSADIIEECEDGEDIDGECDEVRETALSFRVLAGGGDPPPLKLWRIKDSGDVYIARSAKQSARLAALDTGDVVADADDVEEVTSEPLTLAAGGFERTKKRLRVPVDAGAEHFTKTLAEWVTEQEPGLLWEADRA